MSSETGSKRATEVAELLDLLVERAPALRAAGVHRVELDAMNFDLLPQLPEHGEAAGDKPQEHLDPMNDPATFGGAVPMFPRDLADERNSVLEDLDL